MSSLHRIKVPTFDLLWHDCLPEAEENYLLLPGGGGSAKTGVKNQIIVAEYKGGSKDNVNLRTSCFTDTETRSTLCSGISTGSVKEIPIASALVDNVCVVYKLSHSKADGLQFEKSCEFVADFKTEDPSLNTSLITSTGCIVTGGDDSVVRVWALKDDDSKAQKAIKLYDLKAHSGAISSLHEHPTKPWVVSSGKDGKTVIWDFEAGKSLAEIPALVEGTVDKKANLSTLKFECRGSCFSPIQGDVIYTIQSPRKGLAFLIKWELVQAISSEERVTELSVRPVQKREIAKVPCIRLRISADGRYLAVGSSDGSVSVYLAENLRKVQSFAHHDLPVTGLSFAPQRVVLSEAASSGNVVALLASCSADNKMVIMQVKKSSWLMFFLGLILVLLLVVGIIYCTMDIAALYRQLTLLQW